MSETAEYKSGAQSGDFTPFKVYKREIVLTGIAICNIVPNSTIRLRAEIGWLKPLEVDTGELEIFIRKDDPLGEIVDYSLETCFEKTVTKLKLSRIATGPSEVYYLTVRSAENRALIEGPYILTGTVVKV